LLPGVHRVGVTNNWRLFVNAARSACRNPFEILEFAENIILGRIEISRALRRNKVGTHLVEAKFRRKDTKEFEKESLRY